MEDLSGAPLCDPACYPRFREVKLSVTMPPSALMKHALWLLLSWNRRSRVKFDIHDYFNVSFADMADLIAPFRLLFPDEVLDLPYRWKPMYGLESFGVEQFALLAETIDFVDEVLYFLLLVCFFLIFFFSFSL